MKFISLFSIWILRNVFGGDEQWQKFELITEVSPTTKYSTIPVCNSWTVMHSMYCSMYSTGLTGCDLSQKGVVHVAVEKQWQHTAILYSRVQTFAVAQVSSLSQKCGNYNYSVGIL